MPEREPAILRGKSNRAASASSADPAHAEPAGEQPADAGDPDGAAESRSRPDAEPAGAADESLRSQPGDATDPDEPERAPTGRGERRGDPGRGEPYPAASAPSSATAAGPAVRRKSRPAAPTFYVAGFWRRAAAAAIDAAVIVPVWLLLSWIAGALTGVHLPASRHHGLDFWLDLLLASDPALIGGGALLLAIACVYALVFQITAGRTLGMRLLGVRVIDHYGDDPSTGRAALRTLGYLADVATLGLGFLWMGFDSEKRGLHDWISGTYVVKA